MDQQECLFPMWIAHVMFLRAITYRVLSVHLSIDTLITNSEVAISNKAFIECHKLSQIVKAPTPFVGVPSFVSSPHYPQRYKLGVQHSKGLNHFGVELCLG